MQKVSPQLVSNKRVLLRMDLDVPLKQVTGARGQWTVTDDFRLKAGVPTLKLCLEHAQQVIIMGHLGRPDGQEVASLSVEPIYDWLTSHGFSSQLASGKLQLLENLRFERGEDSCDLQFAKELANIAGFFVNESFAAYRPAASTTVLPKLLPHAIGFRFAKEVEVLTGVRENPLRPLVVIIGGAKVEDKLPVIEAMAKIADAVLVGGKIASELVVRGPVSSQPHSTSSLNAAGAQWGAPLAATPRNLPPNVLVGKLNEQGIDIAPETTESWEKVILSAKMIVWNGPLGQVEDDQNDQTRLIAQIVIKSKAESIVGGGDTIAALKKWGLLDQFSFVSTGGGAMLKFLAEGTLPTIEALK